MREAETLYTSVPCGERSEQELCGPHRRRAAAIWLELDAEIAHCRTDGA
jgi:hypothetical protein